MDFPKPQIAAVNGPAEGISITIMGLFGLIYEFFFFSSPMKCCFLDANRQQLKQETVDWLQMFSPMTSSQKKFRTEYKQWPSYPPPPPVENCRVLQQGALYNGVTIVFGDRLVKGGGFEEGVYL